MGDKGLYPVGTSGLINGTECELGLPSPTLIIEDTGTSYEESGMDKPRCDQAVHIHTSGCKVERDGSDYIHENNLQWTSENQQVTASKVGDFLVPGSNCSEVHVVIEHHYHPCTHSSYKTGYIPEDLTGMEQHCTLTRTKDDFKLSAVPTTLTNKNIKPGNPDIHRQPTDGEQSTGAIQTRDKLVTGSEAKKGLPNINKTTISTVETIATQAFDHLETEDSNKSHDLRKTSKYFCCCHKDQDHQSLGIKYPKVAEVNFTCPEEDSKSLLRHHRKRRRNGTMKNVTDVLKVLLLIVALILTGVLVISISVVVIHIVPHLNNPHAVNTGTFPPMQTEPSTFTQPLPSPILTMLMTSTTIVSSNTRALTNHRCTIGRMDQTRCQVKGREELLTCSDSIGTGCTSKDGTECTVFECGGMIKSGDQFECGLNEELMLSSTRQYVKHC